jgi:hypothetical protein
VKVLIDNGIKSGSHFLVGASREQKLEWGGGSTTVSIAGFRRADLDKDPEQQCEKDALFTIGRLARAGAITLYSYSELEVEGWRGGSGRIPTAHPFSQCRFEQCPAAIERSKFRQTLNLSEWLAKGGKKDRKKGLPLSDFNQIPFFEWLASLLPEEVAVLEDHASILGLDEFETASLEDLSWFRSLSSLLNAEDLPDCFHLWTARRSGLDAFLTLEKKLWRSIEQIKNRRKKMVDLDVPVLRPTGLLHALGIDGVDPVPFSPERFYSYMEIFEIDRKLLRG